MEHVAFVRQKTIKTATCIKTGRAVELMKITNVPIRTSALIFQSHACGEMTLRVVSITKTLSQQATTTHIRLAEAMMTTVILKRTGIAA